MNIKQILIENCLSDAIIISESNSFYRSLPGAWKKIVSETNTDEKRKVILNYWKSFKDILPKIYHLLQQDLRDVVVVDDKGTLKIVYIFKSNGDIITYQGELPINEHKMINELPTGISKFYKEIHNGWNDTISGGLGFLELDDIRYLSDLEWGILEELDKVDIDLNSTFYVFHNGASGYLCISVLEGNDHSYLIWWANDEPQYNIDFWSYFDAWVQINFGYEDL